jgi:UDP-glucose 4-epimerase
LEERTLHPSRRNEVNVEGKEMRVLVTGSDGFLGKYILKVLKRNGLHGYGYDVAVDHRADIRDREALERVFASSKPKAVFHLAGLLGTSELFDELEAAIQTNIVGTANVLEMCRKYDCKFIFCSKPSLGLNPYTITKDAGDALTKMFHEVYGLKTVILRPHNAYGPAQKWKPVKKAIPNFIRSALLNEPIEIFGSGEILCDWIYVTDVAEAFLAAFKNIDKVAGGAFDIGTGIGVSAKDVAQMIIELTGSKSQLVHIHKRLGEVRENAVVAEPESAFKKLGFRAHVPLNRGLRLTIDWYKKHREWLT